MAYNTPRSAGFGVIPVSFGKAVQWRLLLLWLLIMLIPVGLVAFPLWRALADLLDHRVGVDAWAQQFSPGIFLDVLGELGRQGPWFHAANLLGFVVMLLLTPFLDGMVIGSGRAGRRLGFAGLLQNGLIEYGRMFRVSLWSLLPYGVFGGIAVALGKVGDNYADKVTLASSADHYQLVLNLVLLLIFVLLQLIVESARAAFIADITLRSATRALWRGVRVLFQRPLKAVLFYVVITAVGLLVAAAFGVARVHVTAYGGGGLTLALLLGQLIVLAVAWMRIARLFALAEVVRSLRLRRG